MSIHYASELNPEQWEVVRHGDGRCLVLAGAGSGKTRTVVYRVAYLLEQGVLPQEILLLTFTNKAAREMLERVETLLGRHPAGLWGGTFHHIASRVLRRFAAQVGYSSNFTILDEEDTHDLLRASVKALGIDTTARRFPAPAVLRAVMSFHKNAQRPLPEVLEERNAKFAPLAPAIENVMRHYDARKRASNAMDFDDLLLHFLQVLQAPGIAHSFAQQFRYVLVDEFQDTNRLQAEIVSCLAAAHHNLLVVGDDAQSIYSFRAAEVAHILQFPQQAPGTRMFRIETNYRSTPEILDVANAVIANNVEQFPKTLRPVRARRVRPQLVQATSMEEEARYIAKRILELRDQGVPLSEIAVLFRATHLSEFLELELMKRDIPYDYRGGVRFFERAHVKDVLAFLRILSNPADIAAWLRVLQLQEGIGDAGAGDIAERMRSMATAQSGAAWIPWQVSGTTLVLPPRLERGWDAFCRMAGPLQAMGDPAILIRALVRGSYRDHVEATYPNASERFEDIEQLAVFAEQYTDVAAFLADMSLQERFRAERVGPNASERERVVLSTIHQAKGLEWHAVFVMGLNANTFPNRRSVLEEGGIEEERRLFYVAVTRARDVLALTYALAGGRDAGFLAAPSMFLQEIDAGLLEPIAVGRPLGTTAWHRPSASRAITDSDDPIIVLDAQGERMPAPQRPRSFLRDVDDL
ncbi:ATP-dependent helicase [Candidatus Uhrbacteria bacterium]|nr:ATP-dependent helicase [Candidatus Uhrbacteria bacterium]